MLRFLAALINELIRRVKMFSFRSGSGTFVAVASGDVTVRRGTRGSLVYEERTRSYLVNASEGGGYSIIVEDMGAADLGLDSLPVSDKLRIARNIRGILAGHGVEVEIIYEHRILQ
jgi:hypothetical protein